MTLSNKTVKKRRRKKLNLTKISKTAFQSLKVVKIHKTTNRNGKITNKKGKNAPILKANPSTNKDKANSFANKRGSRLHKDVKSNNNQKDRSSSEL